ncbi:MAG: hypothetical protein VZR00_07345 [Lachnospiraceae bacterium]|jgi:GTPase SAR1 family protein|nr:hypothetical protein [Lachnospiraceae bacterium]MEE3461682.1 hypothetical protein [Lachnospiraceae bacterium]
MLGCITLFICFLNIDDKKFGELIEEEIERINKEKGYRSIFLIIVTTAYSTMEA